MIATREEIREGIKRIIKESLHKQFTKGTTEDGTYIYYSEPIADRVLSYLHSQGVVIKVDRELPNAPTHRTDWHSDYRSLDEDDLMLYRNAQGDMLEAGYVAVIPLVEEE